MSPSTNTCEKLRIESYNAAVILNNIGVDLIDAQCYYAAMKTFKDAIQTMKTVVQQNEQQTEDGTPENSDLKMSTLEHVSLVVEEARKRLISVKGDNTLCPSWSTDVSQYLHQNASSITNGVNACIIPLDPLCSPLRIELGGNQDPEDRNADMASAILLYNFGVCHRYLKRRYDTHSCDLNQGALRLFKMAFLVLSARNRLMNLADLSEIRTLLLIVVLNSFIQVHEERGEFDEANSWRQHLLRLGRSILSPEIYSVSYFFAEQSSLAPAA
jgi:hypothetical protein